jgi:hypothetical protein
LKFPADLYGHIFQSGTPPASLLCQPLSDYVDDPTLYTPGVVSNADGSISIYMSTQQPNGVPAANWLPVADGPFNVMLRVYCPEREA